MLKQGFQQAYNATADFQLLTLIYLWQTTELISSHPWTLNLTTRLFFFSSFYRMKNPSQLGLTTKMTLQLIFQLLQLARNQPLG